jgi:hypothetical protein
MEILDRELVQLFPTCLFAGKVSDITICDRLEKTIRAMKQAGQGFADEVSYKTPDNISSHPEMKEFADLVLKEGFTLHLEYVGKYHASQSSSCDAHPSQLLVEWHYVRQGAKRLWRDPFFRSEAGRKNA